MNEREQRLLDAARAVLDDPDILQVYEKLGATYGWSGFGYYGDRIRSQLALWYVIREYDTNEHI